MIFVTPDNQALERAQPILPMRPGIPERQTHDYARHGVTCLFAALNAATGQVTDACYPRHRHQEFLRFLKTSDRATVVNSGGQLPLSRSPRKRFGWWAQLGSNQ